MAPWAGPWDEIGAMLKNWLRRQAVAALHSADDVIHTASGQLRSARDCFEQLNYHFGSSNYVPKSGDAKVTKFFFTFADEHDINKLRPTTKKKFEKIDGILSSYQYYVIGADRLLKRTNSCWCSACCYVSQCASRMLSQGDAGCGDRRVPGCVRGSNAGQAHFKYELRTCACDDANAADEAQLRQRGRNICRNLTADTWVAFESSDALWIGKTIANSSFDGDCKKKHECASSSFKVIDGTRFHNGDYMVSIEWYERVVGAVQGESECDMYYRVCEQPAPLQNSRDLRLSAFRMTQAAGSQRRSSRTDTAEARRARLFKLPPDVHSSILRECEWLS